jgi:hypothetical protein
MAFAEDYDVIDAFPPARAAVGQSTPVVRRELARRTPVDALWIPTMAPRQEASGTLREPAAGDERASGARTIMPSSIPISTNASAGFTRHRSMANPNGSGFSKPIRRPRTAHGRFAGEAKQAFKRRYQ